MTMICPQLMDALNAAFSRKYNSLARYILDAGPYVPAGMEAARGLIEEIAAADQQFAETLANTIEQAEGVPQVAIYKPEVANLNYLALDYLLKVLLEELRGQLADYERFLPLAEEASPAHELFASLAEATRAQIERIERISL